MFACLHAQADSTLTGHTCSPIDGFAVKYEGPLLRFTAPEGDATVTVVDLPDAKDAQDALTQAWKRVQPDFKRTLQLTTPRSACSSAACGPGAAIARASPAARPSR